MWGGIIGAGPLTVSFADRLSSFVNSGANLTVAVLLAAAVALSSGQGRRPLLALAAALAAIVALADVVMVFEVVASPSGPLFLIGIDTDSRSAAVVGLLAPALLAVGAGFYAGRAVMLSRSARGDEQTQG